MTDERVPLPGLKVGYVELPIALTQKTLTIELAPDRGGDEHYEPGQPVTCSIRVTDSGGRSVSAELALSLVDLSLLSLARG